jgi:uncharacterized membrane protein (Fun14 family)
MPNQPKQPTYLTGKQVAFLVAAAAVLLGSLAWRAFAVHGTGAGTASGPAGAFAEGASTSGDAEGRVPVVVPYLTAAGLFAILGFAVGFVVRKVAAIVLGIIGVAAVALIALSLAHLIDVPWQAVTDWLNHTFLDLKAKIPNPEALAHQIPSAASLCAGFVLGLQRRPPV